ncbi:MAG TPA: hypothetical protein VNX15_02810, partial [Gemmatimonadales bacterium]|nr:hypothetical protein [Gemmatimonadales bacterium]
MFPPDRYAPPSGHRKPDLPSPQLVVPRLRMSRGAAIVIGVHVLIIALLLWRSAALLAGAGDGAGPRGGGGGGGRQALHTLLLSGASVPQTVAVPAVPQVTMTKIPLPDPVKLDLPKLQPPPLATQVAAVAGTGNGTTGGPGEGPGSGGGKGQGTGTGVGNDSGPGRGGDFAPMPYLLTWPLPPTCLPHGRYTLHFWVTESGSISKVAIEPQV